MVVVVVDTHLVCSLDALEPLGAHPVYKVYFAARRYEIAPTCNARTFQNTIHNNGGQ